MNLNQIKEHFRQSRSKSLLVCEWDTFNLSAAVFVRKGKQLKLLADAQSDLASPAQAFAAVVADLREQGDLPNKVIFLVPSAVSTLVELPVSPKKPKPLNQMHELVRWEAEPVLMQHQMQWTIGQLLESHNLLTTEQVKEITDAQRRQAQAGRQGMRRFGAIALEMGFVSREQVEEYLRLQEWLRGEDAEVQCGWTGQGEVSDAPGVWQWLVSATYASVIEKWSELCSDHQLQLVGLMPLTGNSLAQVETTEKSAVVIETTKLVTTAMHLQKQKVASVHHFVNRSASQHAACLDVFHASGGMNLGAVFLACPADALPELADELTHTLGKEITTLPAAENTNVSVAMQSAASHYFQLKGSKKISLIRMGGPLPVPWLRIEYQAVALVGALVLAILVSESTLLIQHNIISEEKAQIDARAKVLDDAVARINAKREEIDNKKMELEAQKNSQRRMQSRLDFFGQELPDRSLMIQAVLGILQNTINEQIIVTRIDEMGKRVGVQPGPPASRRAGVVETDNFNIDAWALTESAAQEFVQNMKVAAAPWQLEVRDIQVIEKLGPMNMSGFSVSMSLLHIVPAPMPPEGETAL